ncbi:MAG TPA: hypothetical protein VL306_02975 [Methylomirabilota bacterium]|nr:hypothetical protein [Methylomirabilota bacterium]
MKKYIYLIAVEIILIAVSLYSFRAGPISCEGYAGIATCWTFWSTIEILSRLLLLPLAIILPEIYIFKAIRQNYPYWSFVSYLLLIIVIIVSYILSLMYIL